MASEVLDDQPTYACRVCGRHFIKSSLEKHEPACKKLTKMQRKVFDSGKQRASGSDVPLKDVRKAAKERDKMGGVFPRPQTHWRERHEEFIGAVSASKQVGHALKTGGPLPPPPKTAIHSDYVRCDFCGRSFNQNAAERHIAYCKEQHTLKSMQQRTTATAKTRQGTSQTRQKTTASNNSTSSTRNGVMPEAKTPSTASSSSRRGSRPGSAGPRRQSGSGSAVSGMVQIGGAAVGGGHFDAAARPPSTSKLPQPTANKRSNSAPRNGPQQNGSTGLGTNKSNFATPKSAGHSQTNGRRGSGTASGKARAGQLTEKAKHK